MTIIITDRPSQPRRRHPRPERAAQFPRPTRFLPSILSRTELSHIVAEQLG